MNEEKMYVICEIEPTGVGRYSNGVAQYKPLRFEPNEEMWLHPSRIVKKSQLRYGYPKIGDLAFFLINGPNLRNDLWSDNIRLIIDPPKEPKSKWDQWAEECPACCNEETKRAVAEWLKREPEKD